MPKIKSKPKISKRVAQAVAFEAIDGWLTGFPVATKFDEDPEIDAAIIHEFCYLRDKISAQLSRHLATLNAAEGQELRDRYDREYS